MIIDCPCSTVLFERDALNDCSRKCCLKAFTSEIPPDSTISIDRMSAIADLHTEKLDQVNTWALIVSTNTRSKNTHLHQLNPLVRFATKYGFVVIVLRMECQFLFNFGDCGSGSQSLRTCTRTVQDTMHMSYVGGGRGLRVTSI